MPSRVLGAARTRQRVVAAVPAPVVSTGIERRNTNAGTPECSAASWSRREAVSDSDVSSPTTPASPAWRRHSSIAVSTCLSAPTSTKITRSGDSPARCSAGANRSRPRRHQMIVPSSRARIPARKIVAAASSASVALPATSCNAPVAMPPPGICRSIARTPNGSTGWRVVTPSICATCARSDSRMAVWSMAL